LAGKRRRSVGMGWVNGGRGMGECFRRWTTRRRGDGRQRRQGDYPKVSACGSQKSPCSPMLSKIPRISLGPGRRDSARSLVPYQVTAICHSWSIRTEDRRGLPRLEHHSSMSSSDRKKSMLLQVKTMSCHHFAAGTSQWNSHSEGSGPARPIVRRRVSFDCSHRDTTSAGRLSAAGMPKASQAQLA
jgi:hypothetical protein